MPRQRHIPLGLLKVAIERAGALASTRLSVLAFGIGFKHSRRHRARVVYRGPHSIAVAGYGKTLKPSLKFFVVRKSKSPKSAERIPRSVVLSYRGERYRLPTDVEAVGRPILHASPFCQPAYPSGRGLRGSCGLLAGGQNGDKYLITAGHVLLDGSLVGDGTRVLVGTVSVGQIVAAATHFDLNGAIMDIGVIRLDQSIPQLAIPPWTQMKAVLDDATLRQSVAVQQPIFCLIPGAKGDATVLVDSHVAFNNISLPDVGTYAPILLHTRVVNGRLCGGDSGAPLVTPAGEVVGLHVIGSAPFDQDECTRSGWAVFAATLMAEAGTRLGTSLTLAMPP